MSNPKPPKKVAGYVPILWVIVTVMWVIIACVNSVDTDFPPPSLWLQWATAVISGAAAVANYIRYKRSRDGV